MLTSSVDGKPEVIRFGRTEQFDNCAGRPGGIAIGMTIRTRIRSANGGGNVRSRDTKTVIAATVDDHIVARWHMTIDALDLRIAMPVMVLRVEALRQMALTAYIACASGGLESGTVWIVTVTANDTCLIHFALHERSVHVDLFIDLTVGEVQMLIEQRNDVGVAEQRAKLIIFGCQSATRMTTTASFRLPGDLERHNRAFGDTRVRIHDPHCARVIIQRRHDFRVCAGRFVVRPGQMVASRAMACFASDIDIAPRSRKRIGARGVVFLQVGRVALGTHVIPVLISPGPMQRIVRVDALLRIQVKPTFVVDIPGDRQCLDSTAVQFDEVLLQRVHAKHIANAVVLQLALLTIGLYPEFVRGTVKPAGYRRRN